MQARQIAFHDAPDPAGIDNGVPMNQHVAKRNNTSQIRDGRGNSRIMLSKSGECLANDLELSLYRGTNHLVGLKGIKIMPSDEPHDAICRCPRVP